MPAPLLVAAAGAAIQFGANAIKNSAAKREAERLKSSRPKLGPDPYAQDQLDLAKNELSRGSNTEAMNMYNQDLDRTFANSLNAILKNGADVNDVGSLFDGSDQGRQKARMMAENIRLQNIQNFVRASQNSSNSSQQTFQFDKWAPWADNAQANAQARQVSANGMNQAFDSFTSAVMQSMQGNPGNEGNYGSADASMPISNTTIGNAAPITPYKTPSVASYFGTIDPNALNQYNR